MVYKFLDEAFLCQWKVYCRNMYKLSSSSLPWCHSYGFIPVQSDGRACISQKANTSQDICIYEWQHTIMQVCLSFSVR